MKKIATLLLCQLILSYALAVNVRDTIKAVAPNDPNLLLPDMNILMNQLNQTPELQQMLEGFQDAGDLLQQYNGDSQVLVFDVPAELLQILPEGCRTLGKASCILYPLFAGIQFDTLTGRNDGKGYNFTVILSLYDSDSQNEEVRGRTEMEKMALDMKLEKIKSGIHPNYDQKLADIKTREWGGGGSYNYMAEWDGKEQVRYSSYYAGQVGDVFFSLEADGDDTAVPLMVAEKLASLVKEKMTYRSLKSRIVKQ
ncbi:hypothetical protein KCV26_11695 [Petrimonas sulfuriphila]|jgi:hypothetical protein|uniref:hypothetical protein n=1 Tax=Petrimonas sulfuriphila TaxID=285070 RepID=UPI000E80B44A|nr:hypothetical protein [Clostridium sp.]HBF95446.1 hypothetical protein [Porphyromonadaceae bacterium]